MSRARALALAALLALTVFAPGRTRAAEPAHAAPVGAAFDSLAAMEAAGRLRDGERAAAALVESLDRAPIADSLALARALERHANFLRSLARLADGTARRDLARSAEIAAGLGPAGVPALCAARATLALCFLDQAEGDSALAQASAALAVAATLRPPDDSLVAMLRLREGQAQRIREDYPASIRALRDGQARATARLGPEAPLLIGFGTELGRSYTYLGEFDAARAELERAVAGAERATPESGARLELALASLGTLERRAGDPVRAVELAARVYDLYVARQGESGPQASAHLGNLAYALLALGDFARARMLLERVLDQQSAVLSPAHRSVLQNRIALASACVKLGDRGAARAQLDLADSLLAAGGHRDRTNVSYSATVRAGLELREGRPAEARRLLFAATARGASGTASQVDLAARLFETLDGPADRPLADSLGAAMERLADTTAIERSKNWPFLLEDRARAEARIGRPARAWELASAAEAPEDERFQWEIRALPDRAALLHDEDAADPSLLLAQLARPGNAAEVRAAWDAVVRRRGAVREAVETRRAVPAGADTALAGAHARWVAAARHHAQQLVAGAFESGEPGDRERFEASRAAAEEAERAYARLAAPAGHAPWRVSLERVLARLGAGEALVAFVRTQDGFREAELSAFVARPGGAPGLVRLGSEPRLAQFAGDWLERLSSPPPAPAREARAAEASAREAGESVRRAVWDPLAGLLGGVTDVYVVEAGALRDLPWLALPLAGGGYLAEGGPRVHVLPAERELLRARAAPAAGGLLAVGDPDFDGSPEGSGLLLASARSRLPGGCAGAGQRLGALPGAREEARAIAREWERRSASARASLLLGADATESRFKALASGRDVIHLATHGVLTRDSCAQARVATRGVGGVTVLTPAPRPSKGAPTPARPAPGTASAVPSPWIGRDTWLAFAGANRAAGGGGDDGWLTADEVVTLDLRGTRRVVLSACQSGVTERWSQEAVLGMRRAFHLAGARCVVASQWPVADEATREWMQAFYAAGDSAAGAALQRASRAVIERRRAAGLTTHPFYWAAFTATGD